MSTARRFQRNDRVWYTRARDGKRIAAVVVYVATGATHLIHRECGPVQRYKGRITDDHLSARTDPAQVDDDPLPKRC